MTLQRVSATVLAGALPEALGSVYQTYKSSVLGLSIYIEAEGDTGLKRILVDTGTSLMILKRRLQRLRISPETIDLIFITHWHLGHSLALPGLLKLIPPGVKLVVPNRPSSSGQAGIFGIDMRLPSHCEPEIFAQGGAIFPGIYSTGGLTALFPRSDARIMEQSLLLQVKDVGLVVVTGCAHPGLHQILESAIKITGEREVDLLLGGFHFARFASRKQAEFEVINLCQWSIKRIAPCYCTGDTAAQLIASTFPRGFRWLRRGVYISSEKGVLE